MQTFVASHVRMVGYNDDHDRIGSFCIALHKVFGFFTRAETAGDFLFNLGHAHILFGLVIREGHFGFFLGLCGYGTRF